jgi:hypothetical protein
MSGNSPDSVATRVAAARAELQSALDAIEDKLNVPKRVGALTTRAKDSYSANRLPWLIGAGVAVVAVAGLIAWAVFSGDDD